MYNFFSNRLKLKAFKKALKQVEAEGFYADLSVDENNMAVLPDVSKAVASLSGKKEQEKTAPKTVDISELESSLDAQKATPGAPRPTAPASNIAQELKKQTPSQFYESLFSSAPTFLSGEEAESKEFLDGQPAEYTTKPKLSTTAEMHDRVTQSKRKTFANLAERVNAKREEDAKNKVVTEPVIEEPVAKVEIPKIEPDIEMPVMQKEEPLPEEPAKVVVEVVADIPEPKPPVTKTITKTVVITKEVKPAEKPKVKRKPATNKKKKRKYDADISGGFNY